MDAFLYFRRSRALLALLFVLALLFAPVSVRAETEIRSLTGIIEGHQVGGVTIDLLDNIYVAGFGDLVWKITPEGERQVFASGLYGASDNAIDNEDNLSQSNFYGNSINKINRKGPSLEHRFTRFPDPTGGSDNERKQNENQTDPDYHNYIAVLQRLR